MADKTLRLVAQVIDKYSGPIRDMQRALNQLSDKEGKSNRDNARAVIKHNEALRQLHRDFKETGETVKSFFAPVMSELGVSMLSVASAFGAASKASLDFASSARGWGYLQKQTGLTVQTLREFEALAPRLGSSAEAMDKGFADFNQNLDQFRQKRGPLLDFFAKQPQLYAFAQTLMKTKDNTQALALTLDELKKIQSEPERELFLKNLGPDIALALASGKELQTMLEEIRKRIGVVSPTDLKNGQQLADAMSDVKNDFDGIATDVGKEIAPGLRDILKQVDGIANSALFKGSVKAFFDGLGGVIKGEADELKSFYDTSQRIWDFFTKHKTWAVPNVPDYHGKSALFHKSAYFGDNSDGPSIIPATYSPDGGAGGGFISGSPAEQSLFKVVYSGTFQGVLQAFKTWANDYRNGGGGGVGITQASYSGGGGSGTGSGGGGGGSGGAGDSGNLGSAAQSAGAAHFKAGKGMKARAQETFDFWRKLGLSRNAALAFVGNEQGEVGLIGGARTHQDGSHISGGIVQWDPPRRAAIQRALGIDVWSDSTSHTDQLRAEMWELQKRYPKLWEALKRKDISVEQAEHGLVYGLERPGNPGGDTNTRSRFANRWGQILQDHDILTAAKHAGMVQHKVKGEAKITIDHKNVPKGLKHSTHVSGGLFKEIQLNHGRAGVPATT
jgi:hypothetical protein